EAQAASQCPGSVVFAGNVAHPDLPAFYAAADVFAEPVRERWRGLEVEGFGIVFLEAASSGKPALGGSTGGVPEAVIHGQTGLVVSGRDHRAVARALTTMVPEGSPGQAMGRAGRHRVETRFTWAQRALGL